MYVIFHACFRATFLNDFVVWTFEVLKSSICCEACCKTQLCALFGILLISVSFFLFSNGLGDNLGDFLGILETGLKLDDF